MAHGRTTAEKLIETSFLVLTWLALGLYLEIFGPTLIDLKIKFRTDYEQVAVAVSGRSVGNLVGCILGGVLVDKLGRYCHLLLALSLDIAAIVTVIIPWAYYVVVMWLCCAIGGVAEAVINLAGQRLLLDIWLEKSASPLILLHMGYGIGSFLVPLYANYFLAVPVPRPPANTTNDTCSDVTDTPISTTGADTHAAPEKYLRESRIEYPYAISAVLVAILSIVFFYYQNKQRLKPTETNATAERNSRTLRQMVNPATCASGRLWYGVQILVLIFFFYTNVSGGERMIGGFIRSFSIDQLHLSSGAGSLLNTSFWISFTVGRCLFSLAARWVPIRVLIIVETGGMMLTTILLNIFAVNNSLAFWILVQPLGLFIAPLWPSGMAWADFHIEVTGLGMMVVGLGASAGAICYLRLIGYLYEHKGSRTFLYQMLAYGILVFSLAVCLDIAGAQHGSRFVTQETDNTDDRELDVLEPLNTDDISEKPKIVKADHKAVDVNGEQINVEETR